MSSALDMLHFRFSQALPPDPLYMQVIPYTDSGPLPIAYSSELSRVDLEGSP